MKNLITRTLIITFVLLFLFTSGVMVRASRGSITDWGWSNDWPLDPPLPDHLWLDLGGGEETLFLHFNQPLDNVDDPFDPEFLNENLMYIGLGIQGRFFAEEKPDLNPAFTHFHQYFADSVAEGHGGAPGAEGFWLVHVAVQDLERPWGDVEPGVDFDFMPTPAPEQTEAFDLVALDRSSLTTAASATNWEWTTDWPFEPALPDHLWVDIGQGRALFLHYDRPVDEPGAELIYVGDGIRGRFTAEDQPDTPGYVHFHQFRADSVDEGHGGAPGAEGYWLRHVAVREMERPWGKVEPGVDFNFMPTPPPSINNND